METEALGRDRIEGSVNVDSRSGKMVLKLSGRWLSDSCAGADDD
jgi:hypothetical protein